MTEERDGQKASEAAASDRSATSNDSDDLSDVDHRDDAEETTKTTTPPSSGRSPASAPREVTSEAVRSTEAGTSAGSDTAEDTEANQPPDTEAEAVADPAEAKGSGEPPAGTEAKDAGARAARSRAGSAGARRSRGRLATVISVGGELLITAGVVLGLFVAYSLWWTNVIADREAAKESDKVREHWAADRDLSDEDSKGPGALDTEDGIGFLHAPALGKKEILIKPGTDPKELNQGIAGYYQKPVKSAMPWDEEGNFSLAAHRDGHGAKFHNIHKLKDGDPLVFETKDTWYVYKVYAKLPETSKYNVEVLDAVPEESGKKDEGRYITLTTCTPVYTSRYRYVVWGELERTEVVDADRTPPKELVDP